MTSTTRPSDAANPPADLHPPADLLERADRTIAAALAEGALLPIRTEQDWLEEAGLRFSVRWVSSLALKDRARVDTVIARRPDFNPFLPPEPALTVAEIGADHRVVLNKFPVIERHLLIVTRHFEDQCAPLTAADFAALAGVVGAHGGLGFYNGGRIAGASQAHKHLQWIPSGAAGLASFLPALQRSTAVDNRALPWAHAAVALGEAVWANPAGAGESVRAAYHLACARLDLPCAAAPMPPYNLLVAREALLLVPRTQEKWADVSINSLAWAGSLFVRDRAQLEALRAHGPLAVLAAVGRRR
jgi:ATP adenylyltransferase